MTLPTPQAVDPSTFPSVQGKDFVVPDHTADSSPLPLPANPLGRMFRGKGSLPKPPTKAKEPPPETKPTPTRKPGHFVKPLEELYGFIGFACMPVAPITAGAIAQNAHQCAVAWDMLAQENEATRKLLEMLITTSAVGTVVMAHIPIVMAMGQERKAKREAREAAEAEMSG